MNEVTAFWMLAAISVLGALIAVRKRNLVHGVFALLVFFVGLAGLFLLLLAEFIAVVQILVYAGAVGILILFAIMLTDRVTGRDAFRVTSRGSFWGALISLAVFLVILLPTIQDIPTIENPTPKETIVETSTVKQLGIHLIKPYIITIEILALLLTAALVGAVTAAQGGRASENEENNK
ncbi:MAG: NADH-quinone oxidoreductase subunit J [Verrucomicrobiota bacterium]|jgi:NADH-quinone oxidoreductase subunit J|nr:NADH-quinone oxidoreductase subunit J [Verrucomicrobiota bacterium]